MMATVRYLKVGRADVKPSASSHTPGVKQGNAEGNYASQSGHRPDGRSTARRSTGINPESFDPIDPTSPNLSPP
jgi:hypothetical protein